MQNMSNCVRGVISGLALFVLAATGQAQYLLLSRPTDTIQASGQTVLQGIGMYTFEAVFMIPSSATDGGFVFNEWTYGAEDKALSITPTSLTATAYQSGPASWPVSVTRDVWHHAAFTRWVDGNIRLYLDGTYMGYAFRSGSLKDGNGPLQVGANYRDGAIRPAFQGYLDSLRISDVVRYAGERSFTPPMGDLTSDGDTCLLYNFNDSHSSPTVADSSPLGRTGTLGIGFIGATSPTLVPEPHTCGMVLGAVTLVFGLLRRLSRRGLI